MTLDSLTQSLLEAQDECTLSWSMQSGAPTGTIVSCFFARDALWMTALTGSARCRALTRDPRASVVFTGKGTPLGHARCATLHGEVSIHVDAETRNWFFPRFGEVVLPDSPKGQAGLVSAMNNPANAVLEFRPSRAIPYDSHDAMVAANRA